MFSFFFGVRSVDVKGRPWKLLGRTDGPSTLLSGRGRKRLERSEEVPSRRMCGPRHSSPCILFRRSGPDLRGTRFPLRVRLGCFGIPEEYHRQAWCIEISMDGSNPNVPGETHHDPVHRFGSSQIDPQYPLPAPRPEPDHRSVLDNDTHPTDPRLVPAPASLHLWIRQRRNDRYRQGSRRAAHSFLSKLREMGIRVLAVGRSSTKSSSSISRRSPKQFCCVFLWQELHVSGSPCRSRIVTNRGIKRCCMAGQVEEDPTSIITQLMPCIRGTRVVWWTDRPTESRPDGDNSSLSWLHGSSCRQGMLVIQLHT